MALLFMDGFDAGDYRLKWDYYTPNSAVDTATRFSYGRSVKITDSNTHFIGKAVSGTSRMIVGFAFMTTGWVVQGNSVLLRMYGDGGTVCHFQLEWTSTNNNFLLLKNGAGTLLATYSTSIMPNTWHYLEASATVADSGGEYEVRLDGAQIFSYTGDTRNGGTSTLLDYLRISGLFNMNLNIDDLYVLDATGAAPLNNFLGDVRINTLVPTGAGATTGLTPSSGTNWSCVDELPYSASDYVSGTTVGAKDTYATSDLIAGTTTVYGVQVCAIAKKNDASVRSLKTVIRRGVVDYASSATLLSSSDAVIRTIHQTDPSISGAWTVAAVNGIEIGAEVA